MSDLFIENEILEKLGNKLLPTKNIELDILKLYKFERYDINLYDVAAKLILEYYYGNRVEYEFSKIETFFKESTFLTIVTLFIETIDIILLNKSEHIDFENIVYEKHDDKGFYFKTIERVYEE